jgi:hypothetical protein
VADDIATLQIKIESLEAAVASRRLDGLEKQGGRTERATDSLTKSSVKLAAGLGAVITAATSLKKVISVAREFEILNAQLKTATGSAVGATEAFAEIKKFAAETPFDLQQVTEGFVTLVNRGLDPSQEALTAFGDLSSATSKTLREVINAAAQATTGEFESLKSLGIKAKKDGDQVTFLFRGMSETVDFETKAIEGYLHRLAKDNFAGAMTERMETLDGAISNFGDAWDVMFDNIAKLGVGDSVERQIRTAISAVEELNLLMESGAISAGLEAIQGKFAGIRGDIERTTETLSAELELTADIGGRATDFIAESFMDLPENLRAAVQLMVVELASLVDVGEQYGTAFAKVIGNELAALVDKAGVYAKELKDVLNPFDGDTFDHKAALASIETYATEISNGYIKTADDRIEALRAVRLAAITGIIEERDLALGSFDAQIAKARELRDVEEQRRANAGPAVDLGKFGVGGDGERGPSDDFIKLEESLRTEEEAITASYERRLAIILDNTEEGSVKRAELISRLNEQLREQFGELESEDFWVNYLASASDALTSFDDLAASTIENFSTGFGQAFEKMIFDSESFGDAAAGMAEGMARSVVSALGKMGAEWLAYQAVQMIVGKTTQSTAAAGLIANAQAASIQSGINAYSSTAAIPIVGPLAAPAAMAAALAVTQPMAASVASLSFAGAFDEGGRIPAGGFGVVGEFGPEFVRGPADVTSREDTMKMIRGGGSQKITIINQGQPVQVVSDSMISEDERQIIIADAAEAAEDRIASGIVRGDSTTAAALESTFSLDRAAGSRR